MLIVILIVFISAIFVPALYKRFRTITTIFLPLLAGAVVIYFLTFFSRVVQNSVSVFNYQWIPALDINLTFYLDGLSLFFALLISFLGLLIILYSIKYIRGYPHEGRFFSYLLFFMASMLGVVLSSNLISIFVFWELTSLSSFLLIGFNNKEAKSRYAARQALLVTSGGGLALMAGFILINVVAGSYDIVTVLNDKDLIQASPHYLAIIILILAGAFTKSAQFPFHFWLPNAMEAPTPVSAYLHSATMVKVGVYIVFRLNPLFSGIEIWHQLLLIFGGFTMIFAAYKAIQADDMKRVLAFTTISALGIFFMMIGVGTKEAAGAAILYLMSHALYKGGLFLITGNVDHETGTRMISQLSGIAKKMPYTAAATVVACISMAGILPTIGFIGKETLYDSLLHAEPPGVFMLVLLILSSAFFVLVTIEIGYKVFFKKEKQPLGKFHEAPALMTIPPLTLGILGLLFGLLPAFLSEPLLAVASDNIFGAETDMHLSLWHGFNVVFLLSIATLLLGLVLYFLRSRIRSLWSKLNLSRLMTADGTYKKTIDGVSDIAVWQTEFLQNGYLRNYISVFLVTFSFLVIFLFIEENLIQIVYDNLSVGEFGIFEMAILILVIIAITILFRTESRLIVVATLSIIGYGIALAYALYSAPDVSMTQFLAETLTIILLILILHRLPKYGIKRFAAKIKYTIISLIFGLLMAGISFIMLSKEIDSDLKAFFLEKSVPEAKGKNVVNVILVDFRALDTMGEITVLAITMIGIISLLKMKPKETGL